MSLVLWVMILGLVVTALAAIGARALNEFSRHDLEEVCRRHKSPERLGQILRGYDRVALAAESLRVVATAVFVCAWAWAFWISASTGTDGQPGRIALVLDTAGVALVLLAVELWIPQALVRLWAAPFLYYTWPLWRVTAVGLAPLVVLHRFVDTFLHRLAGKTPEVPSEESFEDEIRTIVTEGLREGLLEEDARGMIEGVIKLGDLDVSEIMIPRTDMVSMPVSLSWQEALEFVIKVGHTRIPVYEKNRDEIVGILHTKDLLPELSKGPDEPVQPWTALLRKPNFVPETKRIDILLQEFQRTRNHLAVVLDEYGGVSGLVTMEDVLEEIVGEIIDEYDKDLVEGIRQISDGVAEALGKVHVDEINERLDLDLPDDGDFDTIAGFVFSESGRIPAVGEELLWKNVRITVLEATRRRIERVRIECPDGSRRETA